MKKNLLISLEEIFQESVLGKRISDIESDLVKELKEEFFNYAKGGYSLSTFIGISCFFAIAKIQEAHLKFNLTGQRGHCFGYKPMIDFFSSWEESFTLSFPDGLCIEEQTVACSIICSIVSSGSKSPLYDKRLSQSKPYWSFQYSSYFKNIPLNDFFKKGEIVPMTIHGGMPDEKGNGLTLFFAGNFYHYPVSLLETSIEEGIFQQEELYCLYLYSATLPYEERAKVLGVILRNPNLDKFWGHIFLNLVRKITSYKVLKNPSDYFHLFEEVDLLLENPILPLLLMESLGDIALPEKGRSFENEVKPFVDGIEGYLHNFELIEEHINSPFDMFKNKTEFFKVLGV